MIEESIHQLRLPYPGREDRLVRVFVPAHEEGETFPVIYMTDGQNLFDKESSGCGRTAGRPPSSWASTTTTPCGSAS